MLTFIDVMHFEHVDGMRRMHVCTEYVQYDLLEYARLPSASGAAVRLYALLPSASSLLPSREYLRVLGATVFGRQSSEPQAPSGHEHAREGSRQGPGSPAAGPAAADKELHFAAL